RAVWRMRSNERREPRGRERSLCVLNNQLCSRYRLLNFSFLLHPSLAGVHESISIEERATRLTRLTCNVRLNARLFASVVAAVFSARNLYPTCSQQLRSCLPSGV